MAVPSAFEIDTVAGCYDLGCWTLCNGTGFNHEVQQGSSSSSGDWEEFKCPMIVSLLVLCVLVVCYLIYSHCCELMKGIAWRCAVHYSSVGFSTYYKYLPEPYVLGASILAVRLG